MGEQGLEKQCVRCRQVKPLAAFHRRASSADGFNYYCIECRKDHKRSGEPYRDASLDISVRCCPQCKQVLPLRKFLTRRPGELSRLTLHCNRCRVRLRDYAYRMTRRAEYAEKATQWNREHPERRQEIARAYYYAHKDVYAPRKRRWRAENRDRQREMQRRHDHKRGLDPRNRIHASISRRLRFALRGGKKGRSWEKIVGYTLDDLMLHLEAKFSPGMSWSNYGRWHIDHIKPLCSFEFTSPADPGFNECWALSNLQPLWATDNFRKSGKTLKEVA